MKMSEQPCRLSQVVLPKQTDLNLFKEKTQIVKHLSVQKDRSNTHRNNSCQWIFQSGAKSMVLPLYCIPWSLMLCPTTAACLNASWPPAYSTISLTHLPITSNPLPEQKRLGGTPAVVICNCQSPPPTLPAVTGLMKTHTHTLRT